MTAAEVELLIAQCSTARAAEPGETCDCGRPAVIVFEPLLTVATAWCGVSE